MFKIYKNNIFDVIIDSKPYLLIYKLAESKIELFFIQVIISCNLFLYYFWQGKVLSWQLVLES